MTDRSVYIGSVGAVTPLGVSAPQTVAAIRGGLTAFKAEPSLPSVHDGRPLVVSRLPAGVLRISARDRMMRLATSAVTDCLERSGPVPEPLPVLLSVPAERPGWATQDAIRFAQDLFEYLEVEVCRERSMMLANAHAGGLALLGEAVEMIRAGEASAVLVVGVHSHDITSLDWMEKGGRLKSPDRPNGLIAGEGAGVVQVVGREWADRTAFIPDIEVVAGAFGEEPKPWFTGAPVTGDGLSAVAQSLLDPEGRTADVTFADLTGEPWRAEEWNTAYLRTGRKHGHPLSLHHPANGWGDVGAAAGPLLTIAAWDHLRGDTDAQTALVLCASDQTADRAGLLLQRFGHEPTDIPVGRNE